MDLLHTPASARRSLDNASYNGRTLALIHSGAALAVSLILVILNVFLSRSIDGTGGLGGLGTRAILQSAQSLLSTASNLLLPFWQIGIVFAALQYARNQQVGPQSLMEGFRRFGKVLRTILLQVLMYMAIGFACMNVASIVFFFSPLSSRLTSQLEPMLSDPDALTALLSDATALEGLSEQMLPMYIILAVILLVVCTPLFFRLRMASFAIMDDAPGALAAIVGSFRMMKGNCIALLKVDLKFWWFFALKLFAATAAYGDVILPLVGVHLPFNEDVLFYGAYGLYIVLELVINWRFAAYIQTTYAHCYETLKAGACRPAQIPSFNSAGLT